jgi:hypothetical protein
MLTCAPLSDDSVMMAMVITHSEETKTVTIQFPHKLQAGRYMRHRPRFVKQPRLSDTDLSGSLQRASCVGL